MAQVRIIGGTHRGRRLPVPEVQGLRPTGDRLRETLFNWLQPVIAGARCLDLFAGSGVLGLEAASRGAQHVVLVDQELSVVNQLRENITRLNLAQTAVVRDDALRFLRRSTEPFDLVFLDPPFAAALLPEVCQLLLDADCLAADAWIYLEHNVRHGIPLLPSAFTWIKETRHGQVRGGLARYVLRAAVT